MSGVVGEIRLFAGDFAPEGWLLCDGRTYTRDEYGPLFALLGQRFGGDPGRSFAVPDLRGRVPVHRSGDSPTLSTVGAVGGAESVALLPAQLPTHTHPGRAFAGAATSVEPHDNYWAATGSHKLYSAQSASQTMSPLAVAMTGGGQPHENMMASFALTFIICATGDFPEVNP